MDKEKDKLVLNINKTKQTNKHKKQQREHTCTVSSKQIHVLMTLQTGML